MAVPLAVVYALYLLPFIGFTMFLYNRNHRPQPWTNPLSNSFDETFLKYVATDGFWGGNQEIRIILSKMLSAFRNETCVGVLLCLEQSNRNKFQMIQFQGSMKKNDSNDKSHSGSESQRCPVRFKGLPMIPVQKWGHSTNRDVALAFLGFRNIDTGSANGSDTGKDKDNNQVEIIICSTEDIFRAVFEHLAATCRSRGEVDTKSGCNIYRGYISPKKV